MVPFADILYGCDSAWWIQARGAPGFGGLKLTAGTEAVIKFRDVRMVRVVQDCHEILPGPPYGVIGEGGNSGFQAINLAAQIGPPRRIVLVGFDMRVDLGTHWHGRHGGGLHNPHTSTVLRWRMRLERQAPILAGLGIEVLNASPDSHLGVFRHAPLEEALA